MNVADLKQELDKYPDDWRIAVPDPTGNPEVVEAGGLIHHCRAGTVRSVKYGWVQVEADLGGPKAEPAPTSPAEAKEVSPSVGLLGDYDPLTIA